MPRLRRLLVRFSGADALAAPAALDTIIVVPDRPDPAVLAERLVAEHIELEGPHEPANLLHQIMDLAREQSLPPGASASSPSA